MPTVKRPEETPAEFLARVLDGLGLSSGAVARASGGEVSTTTVRAARTGEPVLPSSLRAIASTLPHDIAAEVLAAFGLDPEALDLASNPNRPPHAHSLDYFAPRPLSGGEEALVRALIDLLMAPR